MLKYTITYSFLLTFVTAVVFGQDGTLDNSFADEGIFLYGVPGLKINHANGMVLQDDGKYVVGGKANGPDDARMLAIRLNQDGSIDNTYGTLGYSLYNVYFKSFAHTVGIQEDQKVILLGQDYQETGNLEDFGMLRLNTDGSLDPTFGDSGRAAIDYGLGEEGYKVIQLPDGRLLVAGFTTWDVTSQSSEVLKNNLCVGRIHANGVKDSTFGTNGVFTLDMGDRNDYGVAMIVNSDNKIVTAGFSNGDGYFYPVMFQLDTTGVLDTQFGSNGIVTSDIEIESSWSCVKQHTDTKLVLGGQIKSTPGDYDFLVERFNKDGSRDSSFAENGVFQLDLGGEEEIVEDLEIQPNGKIVFIGYSGDENETEAIVVRLNTDGTLDTSFGDNGAFSKSISSQHSKAKEILIQPDGKILVAGFTLTFDGDDIFVFRLLNSDFSSTETISGNEFAFQVFPNPADDYITCSYHLSAGTEVSFELSNCLNQRWMLWESSSSSSGNHQKLLKLPSGLPHGYYYLQMKTKDATAVQPVILK